MTETDKRDVCSYHEGEMKLLNATLAGIAGDVQWLRRIGNAVGLITLALLPFIIGLCIYVGRMDARLTMVESMMADHLNHVTEKEKRP